MWCWLSNCLRFERHKSPPANALSRSLSFQFSGRPTSVFVSVINNKNSFSIEVYALFSNDILNCMMLLILLTTSEKSSLPNHHVKFEQHKNNARRRKLEIASISPERTLTFLSHLIEALRMKFTGQGTECHEAKEEEEAMFHVDVGNVKICKRLESSLEPPAPAEPSPSAATAPESGQRRPSADARAQASGVR